MTIEQQKKKMRKKWASFSYRAVTPTGLQRFSGVFRTKKIAEKWHDKNGEFFEEMGITLVLI